MFLGGFVKALDLRGGSADVFVLEDGWGPREVGIFVEVAAVENQEVDVFANVALGGNAVGGGTLRAVLNGFAEFGLAERGDFFGEDSFEVGEHAVLEGLLANGTEDGKLFFANRKHGGQGATSGIGAENVQVRNGGRKGFNTESTEGRSTEGTENREGRKSAAEADNE